MKRIQKVPKVSFGGSSLSSIEREIDNVNFLYSQV